MSVNYLWTYDIHANKKTIIILFLWVVFFFKKYDVMKTEPLTEAAHFAQTQALQVKEKNGAKLWIGE